MSMSWSLAPLLLLLVFILLFFFVEHCALSLYLPPPYLCCCTTLFSDGWKCRIPHCLFLLCFCNYPSAYSHSVSFTLKVAISPFLCLVIFLFFVILLFKK